LDSDREGGNVKGETLLFSLGVSSVERKTGKREGK